MLKEEYKLPAGVYKVKTFRTTHGFALTIIFISYHQDNPTIAKGRSKSCNVSAYYFNLRETAI